MASAKVLIVEPDPFVARDIAARLNAAGYTVCASVSPDSQAMEKAEEISPDIALISVDLQGRDIQFIKKINSRLNIPVVCLIGELTEDMIEQLSDAIQFECVFPPYETNQLRLSIEKSFRRHRKLKQQAEKETELELTIEQLEERVGFMKVIFDNISDGVIASNVNGDYLMFNPTAEALNGPGIPGIPFTKRSETQGLFHPDGETLFTEEELPLVRAIRGEATDNIEMYVRNEKCPDGVRIYVSGRPLYDKNGELKGGVVVTHDVTRLRATEAKLESTVRELKQQTRLMQTAFNSISDGVVVMDASARILLTNPSLQRMSGVKVEDAPPEEWARKYGLFHIDEETQVPTHENLLVRALNGEETEEMEFFLQNDEKPGKTYLRAKAYPLHSYDSSEVTGAIAVIRDITTDKLAMAELHKMMQNYQQQAQLMDTVFNSLSEGIVVTDKTGEFLFVNPRAEQIAGMGATAATPEQWSEVYGVFYPNTVTPYPTNELPLVLAMQGKDTNDVDLFLRNSKRPEGVHIRVNGRPLFDENGALRGGVSVLRNITKLKSVENRLAKTVEELQSQTRLLNTIFNSISDGIIVADSQGKIVMCNSAVEKTVGPNLEDTDLNQAPKNYGLFLPDDETPFPVNELPLVRALQGEKASNIETIVRNPMLPDGLYVSISASPLINELGAIEGGVAVGRDITKIKQTEEKLRESINQLEHQKQLMQSIFDSISDGVVVADENGQFTIFNPSAEQIVGQGATDTEPDEWSEQYGLFFPDRETPFPPEELPLVRAIHGEKTNNVEMFVRNPKLPDGLYISASGRPLHDQNGNRKGGVVVFRDVSDKIFAEEALAQAFSQGRLEIVDTILHNIGNAINSVVTGIGTLNSRLTENRLVHRLNALADAIRTHQDDWIDYIKHNPQGQKVLPFVLALAEDFTKQNEYLIHTVERVNNRATHIVDIVRTQKSFSDTSAVRKDVNLKKIINDGAKLLQDSLDKRGIQLDIDCRMAPQEIRIQESQFHQMIVNLIKNSVEAIDELAESEGLRQPPRIEIKAYIEENHLHLDVTDNGIGLEKEKYKAIFAAGYTTKESGSGLGLHSTANFVVGSGGKIFPLSEGIGMGTTMRIMLRLDSIIT